MNDTLIIFAISTVAGLIQAVFWRWVANLSDAQKANLGEINSLKNDMSSLKQEIYRDYPNRTELSKFEDRIMKSLNEIKSEVAKLNDKLDKKADK